MGADKLKNHSMGHGFTLIEIMIVIAILGILSALAIPNFISYRNKTYCSRAESDSLAIVGAIVEYFSMPSHTLIATADIPGDLVSSGNTFAIMTTDPNVNVTITVTDSSGRCPSQYQAKQNQAADSKAYWQAGVYYKLMSIK